MNRAGQIERRSIGIVFDDGGLFALTATLLPEAGEHGEETVAAVLCDPDGAPISFEEALISTEYGANGVQRRVSLELWQGPDSAAPLRGAGTLISSSSVRRAGLRSEIAFFRWSMEGRKGLGHYEVSRSDG